MKTHREEERMLREKSKVRGGQEEDEDGEGQWVWRSKVENAYGQSYVMLGSRCDG